MPGRSGTRPTTTQRGLGGDWQKLCAQAYRTYGYHCYANHCLHPHSRAIDPALPKTHRWSRTVDHNQARAIVGTALPALGDVRPMHRACNAAKGAGQPRRPLTAVASSEPW